MNNATYLYDGGFINFISLVVELMKNKITPNDIKLYKNYQNNLFDEVLSIEVENESENIYLLKRNITKEILMCIYYVYLSENKDKEMIIYNFLKYSLKYKNKVFSYRRYDSVNDSIKISKYVRKESHKLKGFLRFKKMKGNFYYGEITPVNNVIGILSNHFTKRLANECWIIKDTGRDIYAIYDTKKVIYLTNEEVINLNLELSDDEEFIEDLWKTFHKTVAIKSRENRRCQQNFMPKRYWKNMLEMEDEL